MFLPINYQPNMKRIFHVERLGTPALGGSLVWTPSRQDRIYIWRSAIFSLTTGAVSTPNPGIALYPNDSTDIALYLQRGNAEVAASTFRYCGGSNIGGATIPIRTDGAQRLFTIPEIPITAQGQIVVDLTGGNGTDQLSGAILCFDVYPIEKLYRAYSETEDIAETNRR